MEIENSSQGKSYKCDQCDQLFLTENGMKIHFGKSHKDTIPQLDGLAEKTFDEEAVQTCDEAVNVEKDMETTDGNFERKRCPNCYDDEVYFTTEKEFKSHILNYHGQMPVFLNFGKELIEENSEYINKSKRKTWKRFLNEHS